MPGPTCNTGNPRRRKVNGPADLTRHSTSAKAENVPEWATERWKHQVEAEARHRLKREVHDLGRARR